MSTERRAGSVRPGSTTARHPAPTRGARNVPSAPDRIRIYRTSAEALLRALPDGSIDVLVTDPPYTTVERRAGSGHLRDWFRGGMSWTEIGKVLALGRRKLRASGVALVMTNGAGLREAITAMQRAGFSDLRTITWDRRWPGLGGGLRHQTEFILLARLAGRRRLTGTDLVSVSAVGPGTADHYPTEKPEGLGRILARMTGVGPGQLVVDPFCGSGALLVGAAERGATVVGGDISARAVRRATARLREPVRGGPRAAPTGRPSAAPTKRRRAPGRRAGPR
ncbi:MAG: DNA methyltransferase [Chloroflexota bacterium]